MPCPACCNTRACLYRSPTARGVRRVCGNRADGDEVVHEQAQLESRQLFVQRSLLIGQRLAQRIKSSTCGGLAQQIESSLWHALGRRALVASRLGLTKAAQSERRTSKERRPAFSMDPDAANQSSRVVVS